MTGELAVIPDSGRPSFQAGTSGAPDTQTLTRARAALAEADTLPDLKKLVAYAEVMTLAVKRAQLGRDSQNDWGEYKLDAERKAGRMLTEMPLQAGARGIGKALEVGSQPDTPLLSDFDVTKTQSSRWQLLASLPDEEYEQFKDDVRADQEKVITQSAAIAVAKHRQREQDKRDRAAAEAANVALTPVVHPGSAIEWLATQEDCDLLLTDPPYSTDVENIEAFAHGWLPPALTKVRRSGRAYVCIGAYPAELAAYLAVKPPPHLVQAQVLVWTYRNTLGPSPTHDYKLNWQAVLYYRGIDAPPLDCPEMTEQFSVQDLNAPDGRVGDRWHAWQKPDALAERFIRHSTQPGNLVLDPFAGTGTFLLAAARLGRSARGCETDPEMLKIAAERGCEVAS